MENITTGDVVFDYETEKRIFETTFRVINQSLGTSAFSSRTKNGNEKNDFVLYFFDGITVAIANLIEQFETFDRYEELKSCIEKIKFGEELQLYKTGSINGVTKRIELFTAEVSSLFD